SLGLRHDLLCDHEDIVRLHGCAASSDRFRDHRTEIVSGVNLGDAGNREHLDAARHDQPFEWTLTGSIVTSTRFSPGWRPGYLSWPRYFFAILSMCASAPASVMLTTRPWMPR